MGWLGTAWMLIGAAPTFAATQVLERARWLGTVGQAIIAAGVIGALEEMLRERFPRGPQPTKAAPGTPGEPGAGRGGPAVQQEYR